MTTPNFQPLPPPNFGKSSHTHPENAKPEQNPNPIHSPIQQAVPPATTGLNNPFQVSPQQQFQPNLRNNPYNTPSLSSSPVEGKKPPVGAIIFGVLFLIAALVAGYLLFNLFTTQNQVESLKNQNKVLEDEKGKLKEQVDAKETFGAVTRELFSTLHTFDGTPYKEYFPVEDINSRIQDAYVYRDSPESVKTLTQNVQDYLDKVKALRSEMDAEKGSNASGDSTEAKIDEISGGMVRSSYYAAPDDPCQGSASACVWTNDPRVVHFNAGVFGQVYDARGSEFTEWWKTGVAYHEFAHVIQNFNPQATDNVLNVFNNDRELMADCFANVYWGGDEFIQYGYNRGCTGAQKQTVQDWYNSTIFSTPSYSQQ